jgi:hypothetical protein
MEQAIEEKLIDAEKFLTKTQIVTIINSGDVVLLDGFLAINELFRKYFTAKLWTPETLVAIFSGIWRPVYPIVTEISFNKLEDRTAALAESDPRMHTYRVLLEDYTESELPEEGMDPIEYLEHLGDGIIYRHCVEKQWYQLAMDLCLENKMNEPK